MRKPEQIHTENEELNQKIKRYEELITKTQNKIEKNEELLNRTKKVNAPKQYVKILTSKTEKIGYAYQCKFTFKYKEYELTQTSFRKGYHSAIGKWRKINEDSIINALQNHLRIKENPHFDYEKNDVMILVKAYNVIAQSIVYGHRGGAN